MLKNQVLSRLFSANGWCLDYFAHPHYVENLEQLAVFGQMVCAFHSGTGCLIAHVYWPLGPYYLDVNPDEIALFAVARHVLVVPLLLLALFHFREMCSRRPRHRMLMICRVSMWEFTVKIAYYTLLSEGYDFAFWNQPPSCQVVENPAI